MVGKIFILWILALYSQVCLSQNPRAQVDLNFQGSASLGNRFNPDLNHGLTNGLQLLQNGATAIGNNLNSHGQYIQNVINNIAESAQRLSTHVSEQLDKILQDLKEITLTAANTATKRVNEAVDAASQAIDKAKQNARELGQDISECTKDNVDIEQVRARAKDLIIGCVSETIQQAVNLINHIRSTANDAISATQNLDANLSLNCHGPSPLTILQCNAGVVSNSATNLSNISKEIFSIIEEASTLGTNLKVDLEVCLAQRADQAVIDAGKVALKVAACVKDKQTTDNADNIADK